MNKQTPPQSKTEQIKVSGSNSPQTDSSTIANKRDSRSQNHGLTQKPLPTSSCNNAVTSNQDSEEPGAFNSACTENVGSITLITNDTANVRTEKEQAATEYPPQQIPPDTPGKQSTSHQTEVSNSIPEQETTHAGNDVMETLDQDDRMEVSKTLEEAGGEDNEDINDMNEIIKDENDECCKSNVNFVKVRLSY